MKVGARFGRYRLDAPLEHDDAGEVWDAFDTLTHRSVAVRALPADRSFDEEYADRFVHDAELATHVRSPHVVPVHDYGQIGDRLFVATALVEGTRLPAVLAEGPMDAPGAAGVVDQLANALEAAHDAGLSEQQVSASNVLVQPSGSVYLTDVGIPGGSGDASGVHGLTAVLYQCLTAQPFAAPAEGQSVPRPSAVVESVPAAMDDVIARGAAGEQRKRYRSVSELAAAARAAALPSDATATRVAPVAAGPRFGSVGAKFESVVPPAWRRRVIVGAAALAVVVGIGVVAGLFLGTGTSFQNSASTNTHAQSGSLTPTPNAAANPTTTPPPTSTEAAPPPDTSQVVDEPTTQAPAQSPLPCFSGYHHQPAPDGPCLPDASPPTRQTTPAPEPPQSPNVLPCYPGYHHTPPPDGPCWAGSSPPPGQQQQTAPAPQPSNVLPCFSGYQHTPPPDGPCMPASAVVPGGEGTRAVPQDEPSVAGPAG